MGELHYQFKDSDTAWRAREAVNKASNGLPASQGIFGGGRSFTLKLDEMKNDSTEQVRDIRNIIELNGGEED